MANSKKKEQETALDKLQIVPKTFEVQNLAGQPMPGVSIMTYGDQFTVTNGNMFLNKTDMSMDLFPQGPAAQNFLFDSKDDAALAAFNWFSNKQQQTQT